jgi:AbrB family looped-hinge helix DNA binding protein
MAQVTTVSTEGQIVLPQELRSALDIQPGDTLQVERVGKPR